MKNKCNKIESTCGELKPASCVSYEGTTNENSPLSTDCQLSIEESTQDIYTQLEEINLSELGEKCLTYVLTEDGKIAVKSVLLKYEEEICDLKNRVGELETEALCSKSVVDCNLNFGTLVDECNNTPQTLGDTLKLILNTIQP